MADKLLKFSASLDRYHLPATQAKSELNCHVQIVPDVLKREENEKATTASICLVFDCSLSMTGKNFEAAVATAKMIVDKLHERHWLSLVAFQSKSHIVFKNAVPTEGEKDLIKEQIDKLESHLGGSTNMSAGIESGMNVLMEGIADANVMVLLSDGVPDFPAQAQIAADNASQKGIQIFAVGIGAAYNADQLLHLVTPSNGTVFGDSEVDKLNDIFTGIINRIERIFATNVKFDFNCDKRVQIKQVFKTRPERAIYDSSTLKYQNDNLELRVGNIEDNKVYEFLLQIEVDKHDAGLIELIRVRLQYDINHLDIKTQDEEIILNVNYTKENSIESDTNHAVGNAIKSATVVQMSDELLQALSKTDNNLALQAIDKLEQECDEDSNPALRQHLDNMKSQIANGHKVSDKDRNDFLLASTIAPIKAALFDLILVDPGTETIRLLREIRFATSLGLRDIADIIRNRNSVVAVYKDFDSAEKLQQRLVKIGAKVKIETREQVG